MKKIQIETSEIKLGQFLKFSGVISMGSEAKEFLANNLVKVNKIVENQRGKRLFDGDLIEINGQKFIVEVIKCE